MIPVEFQELLLQEDCNSTDWRTDPSEPGRAFQTKFKSFSITIANNLVVSRNQLIAINTTWYTSVIYRFIWRRPQFGPEKVIHQKLDLTLQYNTVQTHEQIIQQQQQQQCYEDRIMLPPMLVETPWKLVRVKTTIVMNEKNFDFLDDGEDRNQVLLECSKFGKGDFEEECDIDGTRTHKKSCRLPLYVLVWPSW